MQLATAAPPALHLKRKRSSVCFFPHDLRLRRLVWWTCWRSSWKGHPSAAVWIRSELWSGGALSGQSLVPLLAEHPANTMVNSRMDGRDVDPRPAACFQRRSRNLDGGREPSPSLLRFALIHHVCVDVLSPTQTGRKEKQSVVEIRRLISSILQQPSKSSAEEQILVPQLPLGPAGCSRRALGPSPGRWRRRQTQMSPWRSHRQN